MLSQSDSVLVVVDVQEKLARVMHEREALVDEICRLIRGARILELPIIWLEQNPRGLGPTVEPVAAALAGLTPLAKNTFSCCSDSGFCIAMEETGRSQVIVCGIETHICVCQTTTDLLSSDREVHVISDAVSSRTPENKELALDRVRSLGAVVSGVEMALYELLGSAEHDRFRDILSLIK
jgi:nicotinamidase-related amidase